MTTKHRESKMNVVKKAKRTVKVNAYGNYVGYVGGKRVEEFGEDHAAAEMWVNSEMDFFEARDAALLAKWN